MRSISFIALLACAWGLVAMSAALAQQAPGGWQPGTTTILPSRQGEPPGAAAQTANAGLGLVRLEALLTDEGQRIDQGLVWRVFSSKLESDGKPKLIATHREPTPQLRLQPGDYTINAAFGRAHLTRRIAVKPGETLEKFVINAGGLRVTADVGGADPAANSVTYAIHSEDRDQLGNRATIMAAAKPGLIIRLNAGIYQLTSVYGDANAVVRADVTVEAGKLTEAAITHVAGRVSFKLVGEPGGDAVPDTQWSVQTPAGEVIKESVGALPTHILAPGTYAAIAKKAGKSWRRDFLVRQGDVVQVEVVMQ